MAEAYHKRLARQKAEKEKTEQEKLLEVLKKGSRAAAETAAKNFLASIQTDL